MFESRICLFFWRKVKMRMIRVLILLLALAVGLSLGSTALAAGDRCRTCPAGISQVSG